MYGLHESVSANILDFICCYLIQCLLPAVLLLTTPKRSPLRYLAIPCMIFIASRFLRPFAPAGSPRWCQAISQLFVVLLQAIHLLLISPVDSRDLSTTVGKKGFIDKLFVAIRALAQTRGVNTPWQVKNVPSHPRYHTRRGLKEPPRGPFLLRQSAILIWQYLALDIVQTVSAQQAVHKKQRLSPIEWSVPMDLWTERVATHLAIWFVVNRLISDSAYRVLSIVFVGLGIDSPSDWPPAFGSMKDAYTLRNFWGKFWHQFMRQPFTSLANFVSRDVFNLPRSSLLERHTNLFVVFFISSVFHVIVDIIQNVPMEYSGSIPFYLAFVPGIMLEDGVQQLWERLFPDKKASSQQAGLPFWQRIVGFVWIMLWLGVTSTWYFTPMIQLTGPDVVMVPVSLVARIGLATSVGATLISGVGLILAFEVEI